MSDEWFDVPDEWVDVPGDAQAELEADALPKTKTFADKAYDNLSNPDNWRALAAGGLRGVEGLADAALSPIGLSMVQKPSETIRQLTAAVSGDPYADQFGKGSALGAVGETISGTLNPEGSIVSQLYNMGGSALGSGYGQKYFGNIGGLTGALSPSLLKLAKGFLYNGPRSLMGMDAVDPVALEDPQFQKALQLAERSGPGETGYLNKPAEDISSIGRGTKEAVEMMNQRAQMLPENIAAQLGADAGDTAVEKAFSEQFKKAAPQLIDSGIFEKANSASELYDIATARVGEINKERKALTESLDSVANSINSGAKRSKDMVGVITSESPGIQSAAQELNKRIEKLKLNELSSGKADSIKSTAESILHDLRKESSKPVTPGRAVEMQQNLNEVRRDLLREFDTLNIAKKIDGNTPGNLGNLEASIEAVSKLQGALSKELESSVADLSRIAKLDIDPAKLTKLNNEYGALKSLEDMTDKFMRGTAKGRATRDPTRIVQNSGTSSITESTFSPKQTAREWLGQKLAKALDRPNEALNRASSIESRESDALSNIHDLISLNQNPASFPAGEYSPFTAQMLDAITSGLLPAATKLR